MKNIAILGLGTVGQGVYEILKENKDKIKNLIGEDFAITTVMVNNLQKERNLDSTTTLTDNFQDILDDNNIDIVVELTGALEEGYYYIKSSLENGKDVVTANKSVISKYFVELHKIAKENNRSLLYETSVGGGIPIIKPLKEECLINDIDSIEGILNGTCNYILSRMFKENEDYDLILKDAQKLGYAEADPTADVEGLDTMRKLRILATIGFNSNIKEEDILCYGISSIKKEDINYIKNKMKSTVKLLATANLKDDGYTAVVQPTIVAEDDYFAFVDSAFNSISFNGNNIGPLKFFGYGAGKLPTGDAVCRDIIDILLNHPTVEQDIDFKKYKNLNSMSKSNYYLRIDNKYKNQLISSFKDYEVEDLENYSYFIIKEENKNNIINLL
ncbi:MAG: homoserine dehydrogenase, partial [Tissierellia bacterium]|nr:homoserine dehydrogenase [Tissierellia bacterium]